MLGTWLLWDYYGPVCVQNTVIVTGLILINITNQWVAFSIFYKQSLVSSHTSFVFSTHDSGVLVTTMWTTLTIFQWSHFSGSVLRIMSQRFVSINTEKTGQFSSNNDKQRGLKSDRRSMIPSHMSWNNVTGVWNLEKKKENPILLFSCKALNFCLALVLKSLFVGLLLLFRCCMPRTKCLISFLSGQILAGGASCK